MSKIATSVAAIGLSLCMVGGVQRLARGGGGHPAGGGGAFRRRRRTFGGGGAHSGGGAAFWRWRGAFRRTRSAAFLRAASAAVLRAAFRTAAPVISCSKSRPGSAHSCVQSRDASVSPVAAFIRDASAVRFAHALRLGRQVSRAFAAHRNFAANAAFHPFWHPGWHPGWHPHHHLGWLGPLFWPYAYGDFFYYALWPYDYGYYDPFWVYGYGDIYEGIFSPYIYDEYVQGPGAPQRMTTLTQSMAQSCNDEAAEVTGWPIDQIQAAVQPNSGANRTARRSRQRHRQSERRDQVALSDHRVVHADRASRRHAAAPARHGSGGQYREPAARQVL